MAILPDHIISKIADPTERAKHTTWGEALERDYLKLERDDHKRFLSYLERQEFAYDHSRTDKRTTNKVGTPDFIIPCYKLAIEFKRPGGCLTRAQETWRYRHEVRGGIYRIAYSYPEAVSIIENL